MSGIGSSLADLDKEVNKSVPGGWVTIGGLALGGAGAAGAFSGLGAGAAAGGAGGLSAGAVPLSTSGLAVGSGSALASTGAGAAAGSLGTGAAASLGSTGWVAPAIGGTASTGIGLSAGAAPAAGAALTQSAAMAVPGSAEAIYAAETASNASGATSPFKISPMQALMASRMMGSGQQQGGQQSSSVGFKPGQPVNSADPIMALLAPKMKKKERISLL